MEAIRPEVSTIITLENIPPRPRGLRHGLLVDHGTEAEAALRERFRSQGDMAFDCVQSLDAALLRVREVSFHIVLVVETEWTPEAMGSVRALRRRVPHAPLILLLQDDDAKLPDDVVDFGFDDCLHVSSLSRRLLREWVDGALAITEEVASQP